LDAVTYITARQAAVGYIRGYVLST
jgi:hypothetical protein